MRAFLTVFAWLCKITAIVFCLYAARAGIELDVFSLQGSQSAYRDAPEDWGTPVFKHRTYLEIAELTTLVVLAVLPNRWLVFSKVSFTVSLLVALIPFYPAMGWLTQWSDLPFMAFLVPLPLSLVLSFWRQRKGEKIGYV